MRKTITFSVSDDMYSLVYKGMRSHYFSTVSEYIRYLVRRDQMPDAFKQKEPESIMPMTANQCMEMARREIEAERELYD